MSILDKVGDALRNAAVERTPHFDLSFKSYSIAGTPRLRIERALASGTRYLEFVPVSGAVWQIAMLGGSYANPDPSRDFDGRRGGPLDYVVAFATAWLLDLVDWETLPLPPIEPGP